MGDIKPSHYRVLLPNGQINVARPRSAKRLTTDLYHRLLAISWTQFMGLYVVTFLVLNLTFAGLYASLPSSEFVGFESESGLRHFLECFFFSVQTVATIGYGAISPKGMTANFLVVLEALVGTAEVAVVTGLVFARFSRPHSRVIFSRFAVVQPMDGVNSLLIRLANARLNQIAEARAHVVLGVNERTAEGETVRRLYDLKLRRKDSPFFALSWLLVHPIDKDSPLNNFRDRESMSCAMVEIIVSIAGIDETLSQPINARHSYVPEEIFWDRKYVDIVARNESGQMTVDLEKIHDLHPPVA